MTLLNHAKQLSFLLAMLLAVFASGCGSSGNFVFTGSQSSNPIPAPTPGVAPTVVFVSPTNGETLAPINGKILAIFSEALNPQTLTDATFTLTAAGQSPVAGSVVTFGRAAIFDPASDLLPNTTYTATITTGAQGLSGNSLAAAFMWTFTTEPTDNTAPTVVFTDPNPNETQVPLNQKLAVTFSEAMDPTTLTQSSFTLSGPNGSLTGSVDTLGLTATFTPTANLLANTSYTGTITTQARDLSGNGLAQTFTWTFTTGATPDTTRPTVTFTDPDDGEQDVATNKRILATFSETMEPATVTTNYALTGPNNTPVGGTVTYVGLVATFTPLTALANDTLYTARVTTGAQDLAGNALAQDFTWTFTTGAAPDTTAPTVTFTDPENRDQEVGLNRSILATFSETMTPESVNSNFTLTFGPNATVVPATVTYTGLVASYNPTVNLAPNTLYTATVTTGAEDLAGNALANDFVWTFTTGAAPDSTAPTVTSTDPVDDETGVATNKNLTATFSEAMDPSTITNLNYTLTGPGNAPVAGTVTYVGLVATFNPNANLAGGTTYAARVSDNATDLAGNPLAADFTWTFITGAAPDTTAPTVTSTDPTNNETGVALNKKIAATFSESMNPATINNTNFTLTGPSATPVAGTVAYVGTVATFSPLIDLAGNTTFTARVNNQVTDLAGNPMAADFTWTFTTGAAPDTTAPMVTSTNPDDGDTNVATERSVTATFNEGMDPATINNVNFVLRGPGAILIPATVTYNAGTRIATLNPTADLDTDTVYAATITTGAEDLAGNPLANDVSWSFTTRVVALRAIAPFGSFGGGAGITNQGILTLIDGDIGTTGAATVITGFIDSTLTPFTVTPLNRGVVSGIIYTASTPPGSEEVAAAAALDALQAFNDLSPASLPGGTVLDNDQLGGRTLAPGIYTFATTAQLTGSDLTLNGGANDVWIFQVGTSLTVGAPAAPRSIILTGGADPANVYWRVGSAATINAAGGGTMVGTILASSGVVMSTAGNVALVTLNGRAIGLNASVTMVNTIINVPD